MSQSAGQKTVPPSVGADVSAIKALLSRNLPEVFGEGDPARRRVAIQQLYNNALNKFAGDLRAMHPHYVYTPHGAPQGSGPQGEAPRYTGMDFIIARDGKLAALYVYLDSPPT